MGYLGNVKVRLFSDRERDCASEKHILLGINKQNKKYVIT